MKINEQDKHYLQLLSQSFPTIADAAKEIINLEAIMNLPKGTEHFLADLHGESEAFQHVLKNASGNIKRKVNELFGNTIRESEKKELCTLIYYPEQKLELIKAQETDLDDWYRITVHQLVKVCREVSSKYTRSKVRKSLPEDFSYIIEELLHERTDDIDKAAYVAVIVNTIISTGRADDFICAICNVIQRLSIDQLHILGDIYDRGPGAHKIMDTLRQYHSWDIQWGNHDILWMGASAGNDACICNVLRLCLRYANLSTIEEYGINLVPLATFALEVYGNDPCEEFLPKLLPGNEMDEKTRQLTAKMHKAISVLQFKCEAQIFDRHPEWGMKDRCLFDNIDYDKGICTIDGKEYEMKSCHFPTVDPKNTSVFTEEERLLMQKLHHSFRISEKLHKHIRTILSHGCMYAIHNSNLLFHASIPLNDDGSLKEVEIYPGKKYSGKDLMHNIGMVIRAAFQTNSASGELASAPEEYPREYARDYFLYLWCGKDSPLFDKSKMATFERYFLKDKETFKEEKGNYFKLRDSEEICDRILDAFEVKGKNRHIINGHVPVKVRKGETPVKAKGKLFVIDGGISKAYQRKTGIAGYTLIFNSNHLALAEHRPFLPGEEDTPAITEVEVFKERFLLKDTDEGREYLKKIADLEDLLSAYRTGLIKQQ